MLSFAAFSGPFKRREDVSFDARGDVWAGDRLLGPCSGLVLRRSARGDGVSIVRGGGEVAFSCISPNVESIARAFREASVPRRSVVDVQATRAAAQPCE